MSDEELNQTKRAQYVSDTFMEGGKVKGVSFPKPLEVVIAFDDNSRTTASGLFATFVKGEV
jgi:hypothetical protein